jgi:hypothetical protein
MSEEYGGSPNESRTGTSAVQDLKSLNARGSSHRMKHGLESQTPH